MELKPMKLKTEGLNFSNISAVQQWLKNNGANIAVDNMYGKNTDQAINDVLNNIVLTKAEKQQFVDLQNKMKGRWVGQKKPRITQTSTTYEIITPNIINSTKGKTPGKGIPSIYGATENKASNNEFTFDSFENKNPKLIRSEKREYQTRFNSAFNNWYESQNPRNMSWYNWMNPQWREYNNQRDAAREQAFNRINAGRFQQGGQVNSQQQEMQKKFIQFLIQDAAKQGIQIKSEQDLQKYAQSLGEQGLKAKQQEFMQVMQGGVMARFGAKLEYIKKLKGVCPEGYELKFFKQGGRFCKVCEKGEKLKQKQQINKNDTVHVNGKSYDLTGKHKQYPKLTNDKYRKLPESKQSDVDLKDQARKDKCGAKLKKKKK